MYKRQATKKIMDEVTTLLEGLRDETRPATPYDPDAVTRPEAPGEPVERAAG